MSALRFSSVPVTAGLSAALALLLLVSSGKSQAEPALLSNVDDDLLVDSTFAPSEESEGSDATHAGISLRIVEPQPVAPYLVSVTLYNENTRETMSVDLPVRAELVSDEVADHFRDFLRCHRSGRKHKIDRHVIAMIADVGRQYPGHVIEVVSGYRRPGLGAPKSRHFRGKAIDLRVRDVSTKEVRDYIWASHDMIGLGHYHADDFVHIDYRPKTPKIGWDQRRKSQSYRYNPYWTGEGAGPATAAAARRAW